MENKITPLIAAETIAVLENTDIALLAKIPNRLIELLQEKADELGREVNLDYSKAYKEQNISEEAKGIITLICRDYWCTKEQRDEINRKMMESEEKYQRELREKYNPDNIFENSNSVKTVNNKVYDNFLESISNNENNFESSKVENVSLIKIDNLKWYQKIFNKIKRIFLK